MAVVTPVSFTHLSSRHRTMAVLLLLLLPSNVTALNIHNRLLERFPQFISEQSDNSDISVRDSLLENAKKVLLENNLSLDNNVPVAVKCPKCTEGNTVPVNSIQEDLEIIRQLRIEMVKTQILSKLQLDAPPPRMLPKPELPEELKKSFISQQAPPLQEKRDTTNIIVANKRVRCPGFSPKHAQCYLFQGVPSAGGQADLHFWLPDTQRSTNHDTVATVMLPIGSGHGCQHSHRHRHHDKHQQKQQHQRQAPRSSRCTRLRLASQRIVRSHNGWVHLNFTLPSNAANNSLPLRLPLGAISSRSEDVVLEVTCRHCHLSQWEEQQTNSQHRPFLTLKTSVPRLQKHRKRRSIGDCTAGSQDCCREGLEISFADLGWDDWIIQPESFTLYYCKGPCSRTTLRDAISGGNTYDSLLQRILLGNNLSPAVRAAVAPCCSVKEASALSIMWMDGPRNVKIEQLHDMVVTRCGCSG